MPFLGYKSLGTLGIRSLINRFGEKVIIFNFMDDLGTEK